MSPTALEMKMYYRFHKNVGQLGGLLSTYCLSGNPRCVAHLLVSKWVCILIFFGGFSFLLCFHFPRVVLLELLT